MAASNYPACLKEILKHEGGWANHPKDPGGATMKGVTQRVYDAHRKASGEPLQSVYYIEEPELQAIYRDGYWNQIRGDDLPAGLDLMVFDLAVNSGVKRASRFLQRAVGATQDGAIGPKTIETVRKFKPDTVIEVMRLERERFYRRLPTFKTFGRGWLNRLAAVYVKAMQMAGRR